MHSVNLICESDFEVNGAKILIKKGGVCVLGVGGGGVGGGGEAGGVAGGGGGGEKNTKYLDINYVLMKSRKKNRVYIIHVNFRIS